MTRLLLLLLFITSGWDVHAQKSLRDFGKLRDGDLLFVVAPSANAITEVTQGKNSLPIDHVAIFFRHEGKPMVIEANYDGVVERELETFLQEKLMVTVGRIKGDLDAAATIRKAHSYLGMPYDFVFLPDNGAVYCSELVQLSYVDRAGNPLFSAIPMSFHDDSGEITTYWTDFYARRALDVPEGKPGTNPNEISHRKCVRIKYKWQRIDK